MTRRHGWLAVGVVTLGAGLGLLSVAYEYASVGLGVVGLAVGLMGLAAIEHGQAWRLVAFLLHRTSDVLLWAFGLSGARTWRRALVGWALAALGVWLVTAAYWSGVWLFAIAGATITGFGALVLFVVWGKPTTTAPEWYCPNCKAYVTEPAPTFDPADLATYCPRCNVTLKVRP